MPFCKNMNHYNLFATHQKSSEIFQKLNIFILKGPFGAASAASGYSQACKQTSDCLPGLVCNPSKGTCDCSSGNTYNAATKTCSIS